MHSTGYNRICDSTFVTRFHSRALVSLGEEADRKEEVLKVFGDSETCFRHFNIHNLPFDCKFPLSEEPSCLFIQTLTLCDSEVVHFLLNC